MWLYKRPAGECKGKGNRCGLFMELSESLFQVPFQAGRRHGVRRQRQSPNALPAELGTGALLPCSLSYYRWVRSRWLTQAQKKALRFYVP